MKRLPPRSTRTDTLFPYTTLFRSVEGDAVELASGSFRIRTSPLREILDIAAAPDHPRLGEMVGVRAGGASRTALGEVLGDLRGTRSEEHTSELQSLMRISYAVFCWKKKSHITRTNHINHIPKIP